MKGQFLKKITALACAAVGVFSLSSCMLAADGGKDAYELAVEQGFDGDVYDWLESLKGTDGVNGKDLDINDVYEAAKSNGYEKDFLTFLKEYFSIDVQGYNDTEIISHNVMSVVGICCGFKGKSNVSLGSGVVLSLDKETGNAYVVTNYHVVFEETVAYNYGISDGIYLYPYGELIGYDTTTRSDENGIKATYVGGAANYDLAVLKVSGSDRLKVSNLEAAKLGDSEALSLGEKTFVVGNAEGDGISVTDGVLSVESEYIEMSAIDGGNETVDFRVLRTSAAVNHGNSGGAIFDANGYLIGIVNAKNVDEDVENMGYALPINYVVNAVENILANVGIDGKGVVKRAMLGVTVQTVKSTSSIDENGRVGIKEVCVVAEAAKMGAAAYGKLREGDVFKSFRLSSKDGEIGETLPITRRHQLGDYLLDVRLGDTVELTVERGGEEIKTYVVFDQNNYFYIYD